MNNADYPNEIAENYVDCTAVTTDADADCLDNGFGVSTPEVSTSGVHLSSFDLLFVECLDGIPALECIDAALASVATEPVLANTGVNGAQGALLAGGAAVLAVVGAGLVIARRRKAQVND
jgi:LPXTG-motif cell wall-anchored protein